MNALPKLLQDNSSNSNYKPLDSHRSTCYSPRFYEAQSFKSPKANNFVLDQISQFKFSTTDSRSHILINQDQPSIQKNQPNSNNQRQNLQQILSSTKGNKKIDINQYLGVKEYQQTSHHTVIDNNTSVKQLIQIKESLTQQFQDINFSRLLDQFLQKVELVITQIKNQDDLFGSQNLTKFTSDIIQQSSKIFSFILTKYSHLVNDATCLKKQISILQSQQEQILNEVAQFQTSNKPQSNAVTKLIQQNMNQVKLENIKLQKEVNELARKLEIFENNNNGPTQRQRYEHLEVELEEEKSNSHVIQQKQVDQLKTQQKYVAQLQVALINKDEQIAHQKLDYDVFKERYDDLQLKNDKNSFLANILRERLNMQVEEFYQLQIDHQQDKQSLNVIGQITESDTKTSLKKINISQTSDFQIPLNPHYKDEIDAFSGIKQIYLNNQTFFKHIKAYFKGFKQDEIDQKTNIMKRTQTNVEAKTRNSDNNRDPTFDLSKYNYIKPTFFTLIESKYVHRTKGSQDYIKNVLINPNLMPTMRLLFDSFYTHISTTQKHSGNFISFAYIWLGNYHFDFKGLQLQESLSEDDENRIQFYLELSSDKTGRLWEVITMKEFLLDRSPIEEILFYLHCRYLLFSGLQSHHQSFCFDVIHYVTWDVAMHLLQIIMNMFDDYDQEEIRVQIEKFVIIKAKRQFIDSALLLRFFLEFYRAEREYKLLIFRDLFFSYPSDEHQGRFGLSFDGFKRLFRDNFNYINQQEMIHLYSECYNAGSGFITADIFFAVANESGLFAKSLNLGQWMEQGNTLHLFKTNLSEEQAQTIVKSLNIRRNDLLMLENIKTLISTFHSEYTKHGQIEHLAMLRNYKISLKGDQIGFIQQIKYYNIKQWFNFCTLINYYVQEEKNILWDNLINILTDQKCLTKVDYDVKQITKIQRKSRRILKQFYQLIQDKKKQDGTVLKIKK